MGATPNHSCWSDWNLDAVSAPAFCLGCSSFQNSSWTWLPQPHREGVRLQALSRAMISDQASPGTAPHCAPRRLHCARSRRAPCITPRHVPQTCAGASRRRCRGAPLPRRRAVQYPPQRRRDGGPGGRMRAKSQIRTLTRQRQGPWIRDTAPDVHGDKPRSSDRLAGCRTGAPR